MNKSTQPLATYQGRMKPCVDEQKTKENVMKLLELNGVPKVKQNFGGKEYREYPVYVSSVGDTYYSDSVKYRVYFREKHKSTTFVQSDADGKINISKLVAKANEVVNDEQSRVYMAQEAEKNLEEKEKLAAELSRKIANTGFEVRVYRGSFEVACEGLNRKQVEALVEQLVKLS